MSYCQVDVEMVNRDDSQDGQLEMIYQQQQQQQAGSDSDDNDDPRHKMKRVPIPEFCIGKVLSLKDTPQEILQPFLMRMHGHGFNYTVVYMGGKKRAHFDPHKAKIPEQESLEDALKLVPYPSIPGQQMNVLDWQRNVVAKVSPWIDPDHVDPMTAEVSRHALKMEIEYAIYLRITTIVIPLRRGFRNDELIEIVKGTLEGGKLNVWFMVPLTTKQFKPYTEDLPLDQKTASLQGTGSGPEDTWDWWYSIRSKLPGSIRLGVVLAFNDDLDQYLADHPQGFRRWAGEFVKLIWMNSVLFNTGLDSPEQMQVFKQANLPETIQLIFANCSSACCIEGVFRRQDDIVIKNYLAHLWNKRFEDYPDVLMGECMQAASDFVDVIQVPLQPLADNLDMDTYQIFEEDPVKYAQYEEAIYCTLADIVQQRKPNSLKLAVLGAGRGPLVIRAFNAIQRLYESSLRPLPSVRVFVVEKNPFACIGLRHDIKVDWPNRYPMLFRPANTAARVTAELFCGDMREFRIPDGENECADIVVSELLGSFGDNELSPECLDGCPAVMGPTTKSIPAAYSSFVGPLHAPRLYHLIQDDAMQQMKEKLAQRTKERQEQGLPPLEVEGNPMDVPYVVLASCCYSIAEARRLFTFEHPNLSENKSLHRSSKLTFKIPQKCELMGFVGYFDAVLYKSATREITISINPATFSRSMFSWFPIVFPLRETILLQKDQVISLEFERKSNEEQVWYEWKVDGQPWQNKNGLMYNMKLQVE